MSKPKDKQKYKSVLFCPGTTGMSRTCAEAADQTLRIIALSLSLFVSITLLAVIIGIQTKVNMNECIILSIEKCQSS